ncbi:MAG: DNA mismatch repair endonuclease MutL, partial [Ignavibacteriaceae bacterium]|nr:DNA mismatch repair endonuclease MutL [Ignavibacteriaceae bacterium]
VVQRPESVVKELIENSIDSGANTIELIVKKAGKILVQVVDDGLGMSEDDAELCVQKHATSKIKNLEDLDAIATLGFRGEALSAMAAVSQLEVKTETREDEIGTLIRVDEPGEIFKEKGSFTKGTSIAVKNLFYNVPARRNFLRSDTTELRRIIDTFNKIALSHPDICFKLYNESDIIFNYKQGNLDERVQQIFADNMLDALVPVEERTDFISLHGYIGKPAFLKKSKGEQYLFLNNRYVTSKQINHAVFSAYENVLEKGDYPFFILFLEIDPSRIDVNVHPSKLEVRFENERDVYHFVLAVIRKSLGTHDLVPTLSFNNEERGEEKMRMNAFSRTEKNDFSDRPQHSRSQITSPRFSEEDIDMVFSDLPDTGIKRGEKIIDAPFEQPENVNLFQSSVQSNKNDDEGVNSTFIIQLHNKYILSQIKSGLMIIDQHVAHERVLYEKALERIDADMPFSQQLMFPKTMEFDPASFALLKELNPYLIKLGFEIKFFSRNTIVVEGMPDDIKQGTEGKILNEIIAEYSFNQVEKKLETRDNIAKSYACQTAIKAGDRLNETQMRLLIDQLFATSMPYVCPHGRPIVVKIPLDEFDRRFGRT